MAEKRKPLIDDSEPKNEASLDDDFNDLIRRELSDDAPAKPVEAKPGVVIEPVKKPELKPEIKKVEIKAEPKKVEVKPELKKEIKIEPAKKPTPKKIAIEPVKKIERPQPKKVEPKLVAVKPQPRRVETKPEPRKVERHELKVAEHKKESPEPATPVYDDTPKGLGKWVAVLLVLLVAAAAVYAVSAIRNGKDAAAVDCATSYAEERGASLSWADANSAEQYWLSNVYETHSELEAVEILRMLACPDAFISSLSDPAAYSACPVPDIYVVIDERALSDNPIARLDAESILAKLNAKAPLTRFTLAYELADPAVTAWKVVEPKK
ncbi:hypothetical protein HY492_02845 [Candidatus Woesearchaeota archaeon]|nr:hypothetical protein [Candidatus Woesearchaeota archaeon]